MRPPNFPLSKEKTVTACPAWFTKLEFAVSLPRARRRRGGFTAAVRTPLFTRLTSKSHGWSGRWTNTVDLSAQSVTAARLGQRNHRRLRKHRQPEVSDKYRPLQRACQAVCCQWPDRRVTVKSRHWRAWGRLILTLSAHGSLFNYFALKNKKKQSMPSVWC